MDRRAGIAERVSWEARSMVFNDGTSVREALRLAGDVLCRLCLEAGSGLPVAAPSEFEKIAMTVPSASRDETCAWIGNLPSMREWIGPRVVNNLSAYGFTIANRKFESTVSVSREDIEDDRLGTFKPTFAEMGNMARRHPDALVFSLLASGFTSPRLMTARTSSTPITRSSTPTG